MRPYTAAALVFLVLCAAPAASDPAPTAAEPPEEIHATACREAQAEFPQESADFSGLPPGFSAATDELGLARIVVLARDCLVDGQPARAVFAFLKVQVVAAGCHGGDHGLLLHPTMVDSDALLAALHSWNVTTPTPRNLTMTVARAHLAAAAHITGSPDFVMDVQSASKTVPAPWEAVRVFDFGRGLEGPRAAFDMERAPARGGLGIAQAHFVAGPPQPGAVDLPYHVAGYGRVVHADGFQVVYRQVLLP